MQPTYSYRSILSTAYPIILGNLAENIINITDTAFVGRLGKVALGAVGMGGLYYYTFVLIALGLSQGTQILIGRRNGEKAYPLIGHLLDNAIYLFSAIAVVLFLALHFFSPILLTYLVHSPDIYSVCSEYVGIRSYGIYFLCLTIVFRSFYVGITETRIIIFITFGSAIVNVIFNYLMVFGRGGFPVMGVHGSATASVIAEGVSFIGYALYTLLRKENARYKPFRFRRPDFAASGSILNIGFPLMLQGWISVSSWFAFFLLIEKMGEKALAISAIIKSIYILFMIPLWGLGSATNTLVSNAMGQQKQQEVMKIVSRVLLISLVIMVILVQLLLLYPGQIIAIYTSQADISAGARPLLRILALALLLLSMGGVFFNAVSGTGATRMSLRIEITVLTVYLTYIFLVAGAYHMPLPVVWASEIVYMSMLTALSFIYLQTGRWKKIAI